MRIHTFFKTLGNTKAVPFSNSKVNGFNYVDFGPVNYTNNQVLLSKNMEDSYSLQILRDREFTENISELCLTNSSVLTWEDFWVDAHQNLVDPRIEKINLQKNSLIHANFNLSRPHLTSLNLQGNPSLQAVFVYDSPKLAYLNVNNCTSLQVVNLGFNGGLKAVLARDCNLNESAQESLLGALRPVITSSSNVEGRGLFTYKKAASCVVDLRGTEVIWSNRRVASKIRLLLTNNWMVLWDNPPPTSIVPPQYYSFFTNNLEEKLFKEYYG